MALLYQPDPKPWVVGVTPNYLDVFEREVAYLGNDIWEVVASTPEDIMSNRANLASLTDKQAARANLAVGKPRIAMTLEDTPAYNGNILKWDAQNEQEDITYDVTTGVFTFHTAGRHRYFLDLYHYGSAACRIFIAHNTLAPTQSLNAGHVYSPSAVSAGMLSISRPLIVEVGDTLAIYKESGNLYASTTSFFSGFSIEFTG